LNLSVEDAPDFHGAAPAKFNFQGQAPIRMAEMPEQPEEVGRYLSDELIARRMPAFLQVNQTGRLVSCSGALGLYGLSDLEAGGNASDQIPMLVGLLQHRDPPAVLPQIQTPSGRHADVHIVPAGECQWVVFVDAEDDYAARLSYQQRVNELSLVKQRQAKPVRSGRGATEDSEPLLATLFARLDTVVMELSADRSVMLRGDPVVWFVELYPEFVSGQPASALGERLPFLENFLFDAEAFWEGDARGRLKSGAWAETLSSGEEVFLEASAARAGANRLVLIERLGSQYEENRSLLQKARELSLEEQRRIKETQKKEILLHCIVHDLAGPLTGIKGCLSLLKFENLSPKGKELLEAGLRQSVKQEKWIRTILEVFSAEVASLETFTRDAAQAPDALICAQEVIQALQPAAAADKNGLRLAPSVDVSADWKVAGEKVRLERILFNLVENALRHTSPSSTVTVGLEQSDGFVVVTVDDEGPGISPEAVANLFQKFSQGEGHTGKAGLGLYFCRITVERWGGEIGCRSLPERGARFWFRLPAVKT
jgi:hypothetical protein